MMMKNMFLLVVCVAALALACPVEARSPARGDRAPDFTLYSVDGRKVSLADYRGKVVLLTFMATWNPPSVEAIPVLKRLQSAYAKDAAVLAVSIDTKPTNEVRTFARQYGLNFPLLHDTQRKAAGAYGVASIPMLFLVKNGTVRYVHLGYQPDNAREIDRQIKELVSAS